MKPIMTAITEIKKRFEEIDTEIEKDETQKDILIQEQTSLESNISIAAAKRKTEITPELAELENHLQWLHNHKNTLLLGYDGIAEILTAPIEEQIDGIKEENKSRVQEISDLLDSLKKKIQGLKQLNSTLQTDLIAEISELTPFCVPGNINLPRYITGLRLHTVVSPTLEETGLDAEIIRRIYDTSKII